MPSSTATRSLQLYRTTFTLLALTLTGSMHAQSAQAPQAWEDAQADENSLRTALADAERDVDYYVGNLQREESELAPGSDFSKSWNVLMAKASPQEKKQLQESVQQWRSIAVHQVAEARARVEHIKARLARLRKGDRDASSARDASVVRTETGHGAATSVVPNSPVATSGMTVP